MRAAAAYSKQYGRGQLEDWTRHNVNHYIAHFSLTIGLLASVIGFVVDLLIETVTGVKLIDIEGVVVSVRCSAKAAKHNAVFVLASAKLNTVHSHISKALEDCNISDDEYNL